MLAPAFDIVVLGSGGGPCETDLSAYLLKPHGQPWTEGLVALEAGSGMGALRELLRLNPRLFDEPHDGRSNGTSTPPSYRAVYNAIQCFLISHAHFDHVAGLVLSAGSLSVTNGRRRVYSTQPVLEHLMSAFSGRVWPNLASFECEDEAYKLLLDPLPSNDSYHTIFPDIEVCTMPISHGTGVVVDPLAHAGGCVSCTYDSSAFFIRRPSTGAEFLFFGDVEPDSLSAAPRNRAVWRAAAAKGIPQTITTLFLECSWPSGRPSCSLYGHLSPEHLVAELRALAEEVVLAAAVTGKSADSGANHVKDNDPNNLRSKLEHDTGKAKDEKERHKRNKVGGPSRKRRRRNPSADIDQSRVVPETASETIIDPTALRGALSGLRVYIIHCKDGDGDNSDANQSVSTLITEQVRVLVEAEGLGAEVLHASQGMRITI